ncbi:MAG TPA: CHAT domain-containing protein, partial [Blastocatellia bacterium]
NKQPLIVDHEIVSLPSASTMAALRKDLAGRKPAAKSIAVIADPVFDASDERVAASGAQKREGLQPSSAAEQRALTIKIQKAASETGVKLEEGFSVPRLPGTRKEAEGILAFDRAEQTMRAFDFKANITTATSAELAQYRYLHFATHGFLNTAHPELSGILLSLVNEKGEPQNGFLLANEMYNLDLPAEMVVLSACKTGLGKEVKGEGIVGLTRGLMYAGAARVIVSLWSVDDDATAELMTSLYKGVLKDGMQPAAALRAAQVGMWKQKRWQAPYFWAAFVIQGEWR